MRLWEFSARALTGEEIAVRRFEGEVALIVNTASRCGFTPQYAALERLYRRFAPRGFVVLGFPCNQFGGQEPGRPGEIRRFCTERYDVTFPVFDKVDVNGPDAHPLYRWLTREQPGLLGRRILWNFTKFLVDREGRAVARFGPLAKPDALAPAIERLL